LKAGATDKKRGHPGRRKAFKRKVKEGRDPLTATRRRNGGCFIFVKGEEKLRADIWFRKRLDMGGERKGKEKAIRTLL